ncbi:MAG: hypothetical protein OSB33_04990, partial [Candidatus Poseidoniales archaeon]|nr:hypothetical protein [Candidatus Poseidoniales archaeon]
MKSPHSLTVSPHIGHFTRRALFARALNVDSQAPQVTETSGAGKSGSGGNSPGAGSGGNSPGAGSGGNSPGA